MEEREGEGGGLLLHRMCLLLPVIHSFTSGLPKNVLTPRSVVYTVGAVINEQKQEMKEIDEKDVIFKPAE